MIIQKITKKDLLDIWIWRNDKKSIYFSKSKTINIKQLLNKITNQGKK